MRPAERTTASKGFVTFLVRYLQAIWMHTLFLKPGVVTISKHSSGRGSTADSAAGSLFHARCKISVNRLKWSELPPDDGAENFRNS
ncbi:hypothetical protein [Caballeronia glebae]|uniref:hypothetical protein n=1 Tax=Caballeronia glebae TaxID=1777143 RepID=UPI0038B9D884